MLKNHVLKPFITYRKQISSLFHYFSFFFLFIFLLWKEIQLISGWIDKTKRLNMGQKCWQKDLVKWFSTFLHFDMNLEKNELSGLKLFFWFLNLEFDFDFLPANDLRFRPRGLFLSFFLSLFFFYFTFSFKVGSTILLQ